MGSLTTDPEEKRVVITPAERLDGSACRHSYGARRTKIPATFCSRSSGLSENAR